MAQKLEEENLDFLLKFWNKSGEKRERNGYGRRQDGGPLLLQQEDKKKWFQSSSKATICDMLYPVSYHITSLIV